MKARTHLAWLQLIKQKGHFAAALAGVAFAVTLMLGQIGLRDSLLATAVRLYSHLSGDIVMTSWQYQFQQGAAVFPRGRIRQSAAVDGVKSCFPLQIGFLMLKNPVDHQEHRIVLLGMNPVDEIFNFGSEKPGFAALTRANALLFDSNSRSMYGPLAERFHAGGPFEIEASRRKARIIGLVPLGPGFGTDGHVFSSDLSFEGFVAGISSPLPALGIIRLNPGASAQGVLRNLRASLPSDVHFFTMPEFLEREKDYWLTTSPIGFVFTVGLVIGIVVGSVVVYQILYSDVTNHLDEYATMKAMGYRDHQLFFLVVRQAVLMSIMGFIPGALMAKAIYIVIHNATMLPFDMTAERLIEVYALTLIMCGVSAALAMLALKSADPAEIF